MSDIFTSASNFIRDPLGSSRRQANSDVSRETETMNTMRALGDEEIGRYRDPKINTAQEGSLDAAAAAGNKQTGDFFSQAGMKGSAQELASMKDWAETVEGIRFDMEQVIKHESWDHALQSLGLSQDASRRIALMHTQDRQEKIQLFTGLVSAVGSIIGMGRMGK